MDLYNRPLAEQQLLQANQLSETLIFEQCRINKDPKDFQYVARFTENPPVPENLVTVKNWLRFHDINQAKKQDSLIAYSTFLSNYLNDENAKDDLKWVRKEYGNFNLQVPKKRYESSYQNFVLKHRNDREAAEWFLLQIGKSFAWTMKRQNLIQPESHTNVLSKNTRRILMQKNMFQT